MKVRGSSILETPIPGDLYFCTAGIWPPELGHRDRREAQTTSGPNLQVTDYVLSALRNRAQKLSGGQAFSEKASWIRGFYVMKGKE